MSNQTYAINFYLKNVQQQFARRILTQVPCRGDRVVFNNHRYSIDRVEWCLDDNATNGQYQSLINIELLDLESPEWPQHYNKRESSEKMLSKNAPK